MSDPEKKSEYQHPEAFCLMKYRTPDGAEEIIWNSRNGVTPFVVRTPDGREATHVEWRTDVRAPMHMPRIGDRIFVDLAEARAREIAAARVEFFWDHPETPARERWTTKEEAVADLLPSIFQGGHAPDLIVVTDEVVSQLWAERALAPVKPILPPTTPASATRGQEVELRVITPEGVESGELYRLPAQRPFFVVTIPDDAPAQKGRDLADVLTLVYPDLFTLILRPGATVKAYEILPAPSSPGG